MRWTPRYLTYSSGWTSGTASCFLGSGMSAGCSWFSGLSAHASDHNHLSRRQPLARKRRQRVLPLAVRDRAVAAELADALRRGQAGAGAVAVRALTRLDRGRRTGLSGGSSPRRRWGRCGAGLEHLDIHVVGLGDGRPDDQRGRADDRLVAPHAALHRTRRTARAAPFRWRLPALWARAAAAAADPATAARAV